MVADVFAPVFDRVAQDIHAVARLRGAGGLVFIARADAACHRCAVFRKHALFQRAAEIIRLFREGSGGFGLVTVPDLTVWPVDCV